MVEASPNRHDEATTIATQELLRGLKSAVDEVFATMLSTLGVGTKLGDPCLLDAPHSAESTEAAGPSVDASAPITVEARIDIQGPLQGWICLSCNAQAADDLARGLLRLGSAEVLTNAEIEDALGECANMIAGVLKMVMLDPRGSFTIGVPTLSTRQHRRARPRGALAYRLCAGTLNAELWLDKSPERT